MNNLKEINGYYGANNSPCTILVLNDTYINWYCIEGSVNVNATYDEINEGCNVEELNDIDCFTWSKEIENLNELETAINY